MAEMERRVKERKKKLNIRTALLLGIAVAGTAVAFATIGPVAMAGFVILKTPEGKMIGQQRLRRSLKSLVLKGYVEWVENKGKKYFSLTERGRLELHKRRIEGYEIKKPKKWDGKWRIVMFDIKEIRRNDRDLLRDELEGIGFYRFQNSVWIYPYDCEDLIMLIKSDYKLGRNVVYIIAEEVENDKVLRQHFGLV